MSPTPGAGRRLHEKDIYVKVWYRGIVFIRVIVGIRRFLVWHIRLDRRAGHPTAGAGSFGGLGLR